MDEHRIWDEGRFDSVLALKVFTPKAAAVFVATGVALFFYFRNEKEKLLEQRRASPSVHLLLHALQSEFKIRLLVPGDW